MADWRISERELVEGFLVTHRRYMTTLENLCLKYDREYSEDEDGGQVLSEEDLTSYFSGNKRITLDVSDNEDDIVCENVSINEELVTRGIDILHKVKKEINWDEMERQAAERDKEEEVITIDDKENEKDVIEIDSDEEEVEYILDSNCRYCYNESEGTPLMSPVPPLYYEATCNTSPPVHVPPSLCYERASRPPVHVPPLYYEGASTSPPVHVPPSLSSLCYEATTHYHHNRVQYNYYNNKQRKRTYDENFEDAMTQKGSYFEQHCKCVECSSVQQPQEHYGRRQKRHHYSYCSCPECIPFDGLLSQ